VVTEHDVPWTRPVHLRHFGYYVGKTHLENKL
jgi:hypothetical protein